MPPRRLFEGTVCAAVLLGLLSGDGTAQAVPEEPASLSTPDHPYVLHVYTDLLQIPALVLKGNGKPDTQLTANNFRLRLDSGPPFRPTAMHIEGNEPLNLALVLDTSGPEDLLLSGLQKSATHGIPQGLLPHDRLSVYAFDCKVFGFHAHPAAAPDSPSSETLARLLASPSLHQPGHPQRTCESSKAVWDAVGPAVLDLGDQPGRRALVLVSDGIDTQSKTSMQSLLNYAISHSVAIFVLHEPGIVSMSGGPRSPPSTHAEDSLSLLTWRSGGLVIEVVGSEISNQLDRIVALLRSRYILQFPRPSNGSVGSHRLDVEVSAYSEEVHTAGIAVPVRDAALMNDPNTVPADTSKMPVEGKVKR